MIYIYNVYHVHEDHKKYQNNIKISGLYPQPFNASSGASPWAELLVLDPTREGTAKQPWFYGVDVRRYCPGQGSYVLGS